MILNRIVGEVRGTGEERAKAGRIARWRSAGHDERPMQLGIARNFDVTIEKSTKK